MTDDAPTASPSSRFFYGWVMLGVAIAMAIATMPGQTVLMALFNTSIRESLGLGVTQISLAYTVGTILAGLPLPLVGRVADRLGLRRTVAVVALGFIAALVLLREVSGIVTLGGAFFLVRFLGQGSLSMLAGHTTAMWFERRLGVVHSLLAIGGFAAGSALLPQPTAWLIGELGWRSALLVLAAGVFVLTIPSVVFLFRNKPEDIGQHLDGDPVEHASHDVLHGGTPPPGDPAFTATQAMGTRAYWILLANMFATGFVGTALLFHMQTMLRQGGLEGTELQAARAIQPWPIVFGVTTLGVGWLVDRFHPARLLPFSLVLMASAILLCLAAARGMVEQAWILPLMAAGMGVYGSSQAMIMGVASPTIARYFGRTHHGSIRGTISTGTVIGTGGGPYAVAWAYDAASGDFTPALLACVGATVPLGIAAGLLTRPTPPAERDLTPEPDEPDMPEPTL